MLRRAALLCGLFLSAWAGSAEAQSSNRLAPVGGRTALVGGTGLVFGADSASTFLNPASAVRIDKNRLSFSVDFYYLSLITAPRWYQPGPIDTGRFGDVSRDSNTAVSAFDFDSLPGSICLVFGLGDWKALQKDDRKELQERRARLGFCLASIVYNAFTFNAEDYEQQRPGGVSRQAHNIRQTFRRLAFGPTYSMWIDRRLAVGASLLASRSSHRSLFGATATTYGGPIGAVNSNFYDFARGDSHELTAIVGATYRISKRQSVALSFQAPSLHVFGSGGVNHHTEVRDGTGATMRTASAFGSFSTSTPARIALGTGIESTWGSVEINAAFSAPLGEAYSADFDGRIFDQGADNVTSDRAQNIKVSTRARGTVNFGVGGEYFTSPTFSLLGGLSTDASLVPHGSLSRDPLRFYPQDLNRVSASFGVGSHGEGGDLLIGAELSHGWGRRLTPNVYQAPPELDESPQKLYGFLLVLAGSTNLRSFRRVVEDVQKVIVPKKPAGPGPGQQ